MSEYVVELKNVTKRFPGVVALKDMSIQIRPGEIHGLIGENGAGKSTLIKVLTGVYIPEEGEIYVSGERKHFRNPVQARSSGIACVYQELNIVPQLSVVDNIFIGRALKKPSGLLDYRTMHEQARSALAELGHEEIDTRIQCGKLGIGLQQMVEIAKAVSLDAKLIIMDEPTSSLGKQEVEQLMKTVRRLKEKGIAILFVSHKLEELFELCERVTVMRDGAHILTDDVKNMTRDTLIQAMVGRTLDNLFPKVYGTKGECILKVEHLKEAGVLHDVSFEGIWRTDSRRGWAGRRRAHGDDARDLWRGRAGFRKIYVKGREVHIRQPKDAIREGLAFLTEDRKGQGLVLSQPVQTNLILASMRLFRRGPFCAVRRFATTANGACIRCASRRRRSTRSSRSCLAATSRRSSSASGSTPRPTSTSLTSRRAASTSARRSRSTTS